MLFSEVLFRSRFHGICNEFCFNVAKGCVDISHKLYSTSELSNANDSRYEGGYIKDRRRVLSVFCITRNGARCTASEALPPTLGSTFISSWCLVYEGRMRRRETRLDKVGILE